MSPSCTERNALPFSGRRIPAPSAAFRNARPKPRSRPMTSPVERISGPRIVSTPSNLRNGKTGALIENPRTGGSSVRPTSGSVCPRQRRAARRAKGTPVVFATNGTVREARGFTSRTKSSPPRIAYWTFMRPTTFSAQAELHGRLADLAERRARDAPVGREDRVRVARVDAGLLDVLHDARDDDVLAVAEGVDVQLVGVLEEAVDEDRAVRERREGLSEDVLRARPRRTRCASRVRRARSSAGRGAGSRASGRRACLPRPCARRPTGAPGG